jgi:DNA-binding XRE family transcriptional regulator
MSLPTVNLDNVNFIEDSHGKKLVILSIEIYEKIKEQQEELEDISAYIEIKSKSQENFPFTLVEKLILSRESKIKILREHRGYNATQLAKMVDISEAYLFQIENQKRKGSIDLYKKIAEVLDVAIDLLV